MTDTRILIIDERNSLSANSQLIFAVNEYQFETHQDLKAALARYKKRAGTLKPFDLVLANVSLEKNEQLERMHLAGDIDRLVLLQPQQFCRDYYCINGRIAVVCNFSCLFNCLSEMLQSHAALASEEKLGKNPFGPKIASLG